MFVADFVVDDEHIISDRQSKHGFIVEKKQNIKRKIVFSIPLVKQQQMST